MFKKSLLTLLSVILFSVASVAQVTTSGLLGYVNEKSNPEEPVIGASIVAIHNPSGTRYGAVTNMKGRYSIQGMRTGGPYTIEVSYIGFQKIVVKDIYLQLGNDLQKDFQMGEESELLSEVVVTAKAKRKLSGSQFGQAKIENTPTVSRSIYDVAKLSPMVNKSGSGISIAGTNNRYNSFQIDGTVSNDVFGLAASGTNGGKTGANPISMDAIQEIQVVVAPFDVRQSGFTGGAINAITKQGTNEFHGSAYALYTNQDMYGKYNWTRGRIKDEMTQQSTKIYGATVGGPIVKNKLFFFTSVEKKDKAFPQTYYAGYDSEYISTATAAQIANIYYERTGKRFKETYGRNDVTNGSLGLLARLDWNINEKHKMSLRYQYSKSHNDSPGVSRNTFSFDNTGYVMRNNTNSVVAEINSRFSDKIYNEFRLSGTFVRDNRDVAYQGPTVNINNVTAANGKTKVKHTRIGTDLYAGRNSLDQDIWTMEDNLLFYLGDHTLTVGTHNEIYDLTNVFMPAANGSWTYSSLENFIDDKPQSLQYNYYTKGHEGETPNVRAGIFGLYTQDKWNVRPGFTLTYGLRVDLTTTFNNPATNHDFIDYAKRNNLGVKQGDMPGVKPMISPRLGFGWYIDEAHKSHLRGGLGIFTGRVPFVWLSNAYTNTGVESRSVTVEPKNGRDYTNEAPSLGDNYQNPLAAVTGGKAAPVDIVTIADNFKYPQVFRANLALEQKLPGDVKLTLEGIYSKGINNVYFENMAIKAEGKQYAIKGVENSAVPYYKVDRSYHSIINMRNIDKGYSYNLSASLEKSFNFGLSLMASYTYGRSMSVNDGASAISSSNWKKNYSKDPNDAGEMSYSKFDVPHRVMLQMNYSSPKYWNDWMSTDISLIYNGSTGARYSLTFHDNQDFNGDGNKSNNLMYIPTKDEMGKMVFGKFDRKTHAFIEDRESAAQFEEWIQNDSYAKDHRGEYARRNSNTGKWNNEVNLHIAQTIYNSKGHGSKFQLTFDVINLGNMLNKNWGANYNSPWSISPLNFNGNNKNGEAVYQFNKVGSYVNADDISSRWHAQIGAKLIF